MCTTATPCKAAVHVCLLSYRTMAKNEVQSIIRACVGHVHFWISLILWCTLSQNREVKNFMRAYNMKVQIVMGYQLTWRIKKNNRREQEKSPGSLPSFLECQTPGAMAGNRRRPCNVPSHPFSFGVPTDCTRAPRTRDPIIREATFRPTLGLVSCPDARLLVFDVVSCPDVHALPAKDRLVF